MTSPMKSSLPGDRMLRDVVRPIVKAAGPLPHRELRAIRPAKKQKTRLLKVECLTCGYVARVTLKWLDEAGAPFCGHVKHGRMVCEDVETEEE